MCLLLGQTVKIRRNIRALCTITTARMLPSSYSSLSYRPVLEELIRLTIAPESYKDCHLLFTLRACAPGEKKVVMAMMYD